MSAATIEAERDGKVVRLRRLRPVADPAQAALERIRAAVPEQATLYVVPRLRDPHLDWIVCEIWYLGGADPVNLTPDAAHVLGCFDPAREVGMKLRRSLGADPLVRAIDERLSAAVFGAAGRLSHRVLR